MQDIHMPVWDWLRACPHVQDLYFAFARADPGDAVVLPLSAYSHTVLRDYIGGKLLRYNVALTVYEVQSDSPNSTENIEALMRVEQLAAWIDAQDNAGNYPQIGDATVVEVGIHESDAGYFVMQDADTVKYLFQFYIDFLTKE